MREARQRRRRRTSLFTEIASDLRRRTRCDSRPNRRRNKIPCQSGEFDSSGVLDELGILRHVIDSAIKRQLRRVQVDPKVIGTLSRCPSRIIVSATWSPGWCSSIFSTNALALSTGLSVDGHDDIGPAAIGLFDRLDQRPAPHVSSNQLPAPQTGAFRRSAAVKLHNLQPLIHFIDSNDANIRPNHFAVLNQLRARSCGCG